LKKEAPHEKNENLRVCEFETTPKMSTYLIAFVIGEFEYIEKKNEDGVLVRIYTPKGMKEQGRYSLDLAAKAIIYYKDYFGIPYPLPKLDLVAIREFPIGK
jgi:puromycin-sensitive aminopeptidase